jgi:glutathione peroxidase
MAERVYDFSARTLMGLEKSLSDYAGKVLLIVNTASKCGFTPQYEGLQELYEAYHDRGLEVLGFPCNQFGDQEPGGAEEIREFCRVNYGVTFDMFDKIKVNGPDTHPLYRYLKTSVPGFMGTKAIKWNFTKFLVDREGYVRKRYGSNVEPESIAGDIEDLLEA